jgi:hypothetical protein
LVVALLLSAAGLDGVPEATVGLTGSRAGGLGAVVGGRPERCSKATRSGAATNIEE